MATHGDGSSTQLKESALAIGTLMASFDDDPDLKDSLQSAAIILVPTDLKPKHDVTAFPETTLEVFQLLQQGLNGQSTVEVAITDEDYREFQYRSESIILPVVFVLKEMVSSLAISIMASYVRDRIKVNRYSDDVKVDSELHVRRENGTQIHLTYEGPAATYERVMLQLLNDGQLPTEEKKRCNDDS